MCEHLDLMQALLVENADPYFRDEVNRFMRTGEWARPAEQAADEPAAVASPALTGPSRWNPDTWGVTAEAQAELAYATSRGRVTAPAGMEPTPPDDAERAAAMEAARAEAAAIEAAYLQPGDA